MPSTGKIYAEADVATWSSGIAAGAGLHLPIGDYSTADYRSAIRFPVPTGWAAWTAITNATITVFISDHNHVSPQNSSIYCSRMNVTAPIWTKGEGSQSCESGFTAGNTTQYDDIGSVSTDRVSFSSGSTANAAKTINVTAAMRYYWGNGTGTSKPVFVFDNNGSNQWTELWSRNKGGNYVAYISIDYESNTAPNAPTLNSPIGGAVVGATNPVINFTPSDPQGDTHIAYRYQIALDSGFASIYEDQTVGGSFPNNVAVNRTLVNALPTRGSTYYWRVQTQDTAGLWGGWSGGASFLLKANPTVTIGERRMTFIPDSTGGQVRLCVDWTCDQPQASYRVTAPGYDSGILPGGDQSHTLSTLAISTGVAVTVTVQVSNTDTPALNASASRSFTPRMAYTMHKRQLAAIPVNWQTPVISSTVPAGAQLAFMYGSTDLITGTVGTWYPNIASVPKRLCLWYMAWFVPNATAGPVLHSIDIPYDSTVQTLDKWGVSAAWPWESNGGLAARFSIDTGESVYGTRSLRCDPNGTDQYHVMYSSKFKVRAGRSYVLSGLMKSQGNTGMHFRLQDLTQVFVYSPKLQATADWTRYKADVWVAPTDMDVFVSCITDTGAAGSNAWWDGIKVEESSVATPWNPAQVGATTLDAGGVQVDGTKGGVLRYKGFDNGIRDVIGGGDKGLRFAGDTDLSSPALGDLLVRPGAVAAFGNPGPGDYLLKSNQQAAGPNMILNGGFRQGMLGWGFNQSGDTTATCSFWSPSEASWALRDGDLDHWNASSTPQYGSTVAIFSSSTGTYGPYINSLPIPVLAGETYSASVMLGMHRVPRADLCFWWYGTGYTYIGANTASMYAAGSGQGGASRNNWNRLVLEGIVAPAGAQYVYVAVVTNTPWTDGGNQYLFIDQVQMNVGKRAGIYSGSPKTDNLGGAVFPTESRLTGQRFFRTDHGMEFFWDGSRWLSTALYTVPIPIVGALQPFSVTQSAPFRMDNPAGAIPNMNLWVYTWHTSVYISGTCNATNYWQADLIASLQNNTASGMGSHLLNSGANWMPFVTYINGFVTPATYYTFQVNWTKVGAPGNIYPQHTLAYRLSPTN